METTARSSRSEGPPVSGTQSVGQVTIGLLLSLPIVAMILITGLDFRLIGDEGTYHIKVVESFAEDWPIIDVSDYPSASTPLSYLLITVIGKVVGFEIWKLRLLSCCATFLAAYLFHGLCRRLGLPHPLFTSFSLLLFPYIYFFGFTIFPTAIALLFGIWALTYYLRDDHSHRSLLMGSALATLAIYTRQSYIVMPAGMFLAELLEIVRHGFKPPGRIAYLRLLIVAIPMALFLPLVILWGGFTPPSSQATHGGAWSLTFEPQQFNYVLMCIGFYFLPSLGNAQLVSLVRQRRKSLLAGVALVPFHFLVPVIFNDEPGRSQVAGLVIHGLDVLRGFFGTAVESIVAFGLWAVGLVIVVNEVGRARWSVQETRLVAMAASFFGLIGFSPYVYERYYLLLIPLLLLILHKKARSRAFIAFWLGFEVLVAVGYSYWRIALK